MRSARLVARSCPALEAAQSGAGWPPAPESSEAKAHQHRGALCSLSSLSSLRSSPGPRLGLWLSRRPRGRWARPGAPGDRSASARERGALREFCTPRARFSIPFLAALLAIVSSPSSLLPSSCPPASGFGFPNLSQRTLPFTVTAPQTSRTHRTPYMVVLPLLMQRRVSPPTRRRFPVRFVLLANLLQHHLPVLHNAASCILTAQFAPACIPGPSTACGSGGGSSCGGFRKNRTSAAQLGKHKSETVAALSPARQLRGHEDLEASPLAGTLVSQKQIPTAAFSSTSKTTRQSGSPQSHRQSDVFLASAVLRDGEKHGDE